MRWILGAGLVRLVLGLAGTALVVLGLAGSTSAARRAGGGARLVTAGRLLASDSPQPLYGVAVSGQAVFAAGPADLGGRQRGVVHVFAEPAGGWSGGAKQTAVLVPSDGNDLGGAVAASGQAVVASGEGSVYVFTEPAGGWSGIVHESARLTPSDAPAGGSGLSSVAIDGQTVVAGTPGSSPGPGSDTPGATYVFTEPVGGWSGSLHESAKLTAAHGSLGDGLGWTVAISGQTIAASAPYASTGRSGPGQSGAVYVFTEPAGGWSTETEAARLTASSTGLLPSGIAVAGQSVFASAPYPGGGAYVFTQPAGGWSGSVHETARLTEPNNDLFFSLAASGQTVVASGAGAAYVFTEPAGGWSSETQPAALTAPAGGSVAISGQTVVSSGGGIDAAYVFVSPPADWSNETPAATLTATGPGGQVEFGSVATSGAVLVAGAPQAMVGLIKNQGAVYVFTRPAGGWASKSEAARLIASDGGAGDYFGSMVAISGDTVVAGSAGPSVCTTAQCPGQLPSGKVLYVFTKPPGGWSGTVTERAKLTVAQPDVGQFDWVAISANTIVALALPPSGAKAQAPTLDVFTRPAAGWSGTVTPSATLSVSRGALMQGVGPSIAISGRDIFASGATSPKNGAVFVFERPRRGWTGIIHQHATLTVRSLNGGSPPIAALGSGVVAGVSGSSTPSVEVFKKPRRGWSGRIRPAARLGPKSLPDDGRYTNSLTASGATIAALVIGPWSSSCGVTLVCSETLSTFTRPHRGWRGTISADAEAEVTPPDLNGYPLAIAGSTIATGGQGAIDLFTHIKRTAAHRS